MKTRSALSAIPTYHPGKSPDTGIKLSSNENPIGTAPKAVEAYEAVETRLNVYPDGGATKLRETLAARLSLSRDHIIVGNGSDELLTLIAGATVEPGRNTVSSAHSFSQYAFATRIFDGEARTAPMAEGYVHDLDAMAKATDDNTAIVFVCNPNNPTGTWLSHDAIVAFLEKIDGDTLVVLDEAYIEYSAGGDMPRSLELLSRFPNLIVLRTFSKIYGLASLRIGYGIAAPDILGELLKIKQPFNANAAAQAAATAALSDGSFVERSLEINRAGMQLMHDELTRRGLAVLPSKANFLCIELPQAATPVARAMLDDGVAIRSLESFGLSQHIRVTVGTEDQIRRFFDSLDRALNQ